MKKILVVVSAVMVALVNFGAGFVFAQSNIAHAAGLPAGYGRGGQMAGRGGMTLAPARSAGVFANLREFCRAKRVCLICAFAKHTDFPLTLAFPSGEGLGMREGTEPRMSGLFLR